MTRPEDRAAASYRADPDVLTVSRMAPVGEEILIAVHADGGVTAFNGHVDLGTGIRTALAQSWERPPPRPIRARRSRARRSRSPPPRSPAPPPPRAPSSCGKGRGLSLIHI